MLEIKGKVNTAICYASVIEEEAIEQIRRMCDYEFTAGSRIRIAACATMNLLRAAGSVSCRMCTRARAARSVRP